MLNNAIRSFRKCIRNAMLQKRYDIIKVFLQQLRYFNYWSQSGMGRREIPFLEEIPCGLFITIIP